MATSAWSPDPWLLARCAGRAMEQCGRIFCNILLLAMYVFAIRPTGPDLLPPLGEMTLSLADSTARCFRHKRQKEQAGGFQCLTLAWGYTLRMG